MNSESLAERRYREYLNTISLMSLRVLGRNSGVAKASSLNKDVLIEELISIFTHKSYPAPKSNKGAPAKQNYIDPAILAELEEIRRAVEEDGQEEYLIVSSGEPKPFVYDQPVYRGILDITANGYGFLRTKNFQPSRNGEDIFVPANAIHNFRLRQGDCVVCTASMNRKNESAALEEILSINETPVERCENRLRYEELTACYPDEQIRLSDGDSALSLRVLDLFVPIGKGQRALIIAPPKAGKTTLLKDVARAIDENHEELCLIVLLIDERPEEVTDIRSSVRHAEVVSSTFDEGAEHHVRAAELTVEYAKRLAEQGRDVVLLLDSITKLTRAYNGISDHTGKTLSGGLDAAALSEPKKFFGAARNTAEAGSLTILATALVDTGSRMDDVIYEEFKGTGNADVFLSRELAERRIFPAIDLRRSGTRKEELLLSDDALSAAYELRSRGLCDNTSGLFEMMKKTKSNEEFFERLPDWLKTFRKS